MTPTTVCNVRTMTPEEIMAPDVVYVGRRMPRHKCAKVKAGSPFGNPFTGKDGDLPTILRKYREHVLSRPDLVSLLPTLAGKRLACWCCESDIPIEEEPDRVCHAEILSDLAEGRDSPV